MKIIPRRSLLNEHLLRPYAVDSLPRNLDAQWLDKNENLDPILLSLSEQALKSISSLSLATYPEAGGLYRELAEMDGVSPKSLLFTAGSDGAIRMVFETFVDVGDVVIHTSPTFAMYSIYCQMFGAIAKTIEYKRGESGPWLDVDELINTIKLVRPRLLCLPNPDSPTGTVLSSDILAKILNHCERLGVIMLIDEAYYPFYKCTAIHRINQSRNLIVARTFSKAWGAAGLRIGYAAAHPETIKYLHQMRPMYEVSTVAIEFMHKMLDFKEEVLNSVERILDGKLFFRGEMDRLGFKSLQTEGNFVHVAFGDNSDKIHNALEGKVLYRKNFEHPSLIGYSRFSIGPRSVMAKVVEWIDMKLRGDL